MPQFNRELGDALEVFDRGRAEVLAHELVEGLRRREEDQKIPAGDAKKTLGILRRRRLSNLMRDVADAFLASGVEAPTRHWQYARCLLGQGRVAFAPRVLAPLVAPTAQGRCLWP